MFRRFLICDFRKPYTLTQVIDAIRAVGGEVAGWVGSGAPREMPERRGLSDAPVHTLPAGWLPVFDTPAPVDPGAVDALSAHERDVMHLLDRAHPGLRTSGYAERQRVLHMGIGSADAILAETSPDTAVFSDTPHNWLTYLLFRMCRLRGIQTLVLQKTALPHCYRARDGYEEPDPILAATYQAVRANARRAAPIRISGESRAFLERLSSPAGPTEPQRYVVGKAPGGRSTARRRVLRRSFGKARRAAESMLRQIDRLHYERVADHAPDLGDPFVLFALHLQPERTSMPEGGPFADQWLALQAVAHSLPSGWRLYVREHPATFIHGGRYTRGRAFYDAIRRLPETSLISVATNSRFLLGKARAVATLTGTIGFESLVCGRPVLAFGHARYATCHGAFAVRTLDECRRALTQVADGVRVDDADITAFARAVEDLSATVPLEGHAKTVRGRGKAAALVRALQVEPGPASGSIPGRRR